MVMPIKGLKSFAKRIPLPRTPSEIIATIQDSGIKVVEHHCLGPRGTNIGQAAEDWSRQAGIQEKTKIFFFDSPEDSLAKAKEVEEDGVVAISWACAVYWKLHRLFFSNPDTYLFFLQHVMPLDDMQLATRPALIGEIIDNELPKHWKIAGHPSPIVLVEGLGCELVEAKSNSDAADLCHQGKVEACITTKMAAEERELAEIFYFGDPDMIFTGALPLPSARIVSAVYKRIRYDILTVQWMGKGRTWYTEIKS